MKKNYALLFLLLVSSFGFAQPIITAIVDGPCSGGTPKMLEIYAQGTVNFSTYSLENQTNANTTWGSPAALTDLGTVTDAFVYVYNGDPAIFNAEFPGVTNSVSLSVMNLNGDDRIRIVDASSAVIDVFGVDGVDGSGEAWEYLDSYAKRVSGTSASATFNLADWIFAGINTLDNTGLCNSSSTLASIIEIGTFSNAATPSLTIASPANNSVFAPSTTELDITLAINNFVVANPGSGDGHIHYSLNGVAQPMVYTNDSPINVTGLVPGTHQLMFMLVDDNHDPISPAVNATLDFEIASYTTVADLAALRADVTANGEGGYYELTSVPVITYARDTRNQKYIQDTSAGILIDDNDGVIATAMVMGDAISGLKGQATSYLGVLQLVPTVDASIDSSNNTITPETVTVADLAANHEDYESELIMLSSTTIDEGDGTATFAVNTNLNLDNASLIFRTMFAEADYVVNAAVIPQGQIPFTALVAEFNGTPQVVARNSADFATNSTATFTNNNFTIYPNPSKGMVTVKADNLTNVAVYNTLGKMVLSTNQATFNTDSLQTGIYFVKVTANGATATQKLIVK